MDDTKPLIKILKDMGYDVKTASNSLSDEAVRRIREVVAPHIQQGLKEVKVPPINQTRVEPEVPKKPTPTVRLNKAADSRLVPKAPERVIRIASRATDAEREAILDRHRRKLLGEAPMETAMEAKQAPALQLAEAQAQAAEAAQVAAVAAAEAAAEARALELTTAVASTTEAVEPAGQSAPALQNQSQLKPPDAGGDKQRTLPPDQAIAAQYRDKVPPVGQPAPAIPPTPAAAAAPPVAPPVPEKLIERFAERAAVASGAKTREMSPMAAKKPLRPMGQQQQGRPGGMSRNFRGGGRGDRRKRAEGRGLGDAVEMKNQLEIPELISVADLAGRLRVPASDVIKSLIREGQMVTINQALSYEQASKLAISYGFEVSEALDEMPDLDLLEDDNQEDQVARPPVVTVLGHVDHGKTSLLDAIRKANVTASEAGGITQRIGAYTVSFKDHLVTFIDTPGHEAFTAMRARGAQVTDIAVLVVAADDGVMPQTVEAINHARAAKVPIIVAVNKIDKPNANPEKVLQQLTEYNLVPEAWGGDTITVNVSATKKEGIDELLDMVLLVAEMQDIKANPNKPATGTIIEAGLDKGLGPVATVLVQNGTLKVGDVVVVGDAWGRVRILHNEDGKKIKAAKPSFPAEIIGLSEIPDAGDTLQVVDDEKMAKQVAEARSQKSRQGRIKSSGGRTSLEDFFATQVTEEIKELRVLVKAEGQGSLEALLASLEKLTTEEVKLGVVHGAVGAIRETDVMLASASKAIIIGFNVRPDTAVKRLADQEGVEIRLYRVIYTMLDEIRKAMAGLLAPDISEVELGRVEVRQVLKVTKVGKIAGCHVLEGKITRDAEVRLVREGIVVYEGRVESLKRFKDDVKEVTEGYECGLTIVNYPDVQEGDIIEAYRKEMTQREEL